MIRFKLNVDQVRKLREACERIENELIMTTSEEERFMVVDVTWEGALSVPEIPTSEISGVTHLRIGAIEGNVESDEEWIV